jgi:hypothetical protein
MTNENIKNKSILISNELIVKTFNKDFTPVALATTLFAPFNRIKLILQTNKLISINDHEKVLKLSPLIQSKRIN